MMQANQDLFEPSRREQHSDNDVQILRKAAHRMAELQRPAPRFRTRELVGFLLSHGARNWRASMPAAHVRMRVLSPLGLTAVHLRVR